MKRFTIILLIAVCTSTAAYSQMSTFFAGGGLNLSKGKYEGLNNVIKTYNELGKSNGSLMSEMKPITFTYGFNALIGGYAYNDVVGAYYSLSFLSRRASTFGTMLNNNRTDLRLNEYGLGIEGGYGLDGDNYIISVGASLDLSSLKILAKKPQESAFSSVFNNFMLNYGVFIDANILINESFSIGVHPYYQLGGQETHFGDVQDAINPPSSTFDYDQFISNTSVMGITISARYLLEM